jgi:hypothetical protein
MAVDTEKDVLHAIQPVVARRHASTGRRAAALSTIAMTSLRR